ncbi:MAG: hypothetical protein QOK37_2115 [Thermoanaerobaculia bacterium]|jgi:hypothetical protein|nr:hypothetical protein [Thermoanaerobaculia bacterium]
MNEVGHDLDRLFEYLRRREAQHEDRLVSFPSRRPLALGSAIAGRKTDG